MAYIVEVLLSTLLLLAVTVPSSSVTTIIVEKNATEKGIYTSIQTAIDTIPAPNKDWVIVDIGVGTFWEKVVIPINKPYIIIKGKGMDLTQIVFDGHNGTDKSYTFKSEAPNVVVKNLSIRNVHDWFSYNTQAVSTEIDGDMTYFEKVGIYAYQDTLWDREGRHYFNNCIVEGAVDFIFGDGRSIYEGTNISVIGDGFITAHARNYTENNTGFVFKNCAVHGTHQTLLGRAWGLYSLTIFSHCYLSSAIKALGWYAWTAIGHEDQLLYAEDSCYGPGSNTTGRVTWEAHLSPEKVKAYTSLDYINASDWLLTPPYQNY